MRTTILSLFVGALAFGQQNYFVSPQGKSHVITEEKEFDQTQGTAQENSRTSYIYEMNGTRLYQIEYNDVDDQGILDLQTRKTMTYDAQNRISKINEEETDGQGSMNQATEVSYTYNANNQPVEILVKNYDPYDGTYQIEKKYVFQYQQEKVQQILWLNGENLDLLYIDSFSYDSNNNLIQYTRTTATGENLDRKNYTYSPQGKCTGYIWEKANNNGSWRNFRKVEYIYDTNNENVIEETSFTYTNNAWRQNFKTEYNYDSSKLSSSVYTYNEYQDYLVLNEWIDNKNVVANAKYYSYDHNPNINDWVYQTSKDLIYTDANLLSTTELKNNEKDIAIYPNPTHSTFKIANNIANAKVKIIDMLGRIVKTYETKETEYSVQDLKKGTYFVIITNGKTTKSISLIIN